MEEWREFEEIRVTLLYRAKTFGKLHEVDERSTSDE